MFTLLEAIEILYDRMKVAHRGSQNEVYHQDTRDSLAGQYIAIREAIVLLEKVDTKGKMKC